MPDPPIFTTVVAHYHRYHCPYEEEFDTVDESFSFLAYGEDSGNISSGDVVAGDTVYKKGTPEHERLLFAAWDALA